MRETKTFNAELWSEGARGKMDAPSPKPYVANMIPYGGGGLGPRPGWKAQWTVNHGANTIYAAFFANFYYAGSPVPCIADVGATGVQLYRVDDGTNFAGNATALSRYNIAQLSDTQWLIGPSLYDFSLTGPGVAPHAIAAPTNMDTTLQTEFGFAYVYVQGAVKFAGRAWYWGVAGASGSDFGTRNRLYYSDQYAYSSFTEGAGTQYITIDQGVEGAFVVGDALFIYDSLKVWWKLDMGNSGDPQDAYLTRVGVGRVPDTFAGVSITDDVAFFIGNNKVCAYDAQGLDDKTLAHLTFNRQSITALPSDTQGSEANTIYLPWASAFVTGSEFNAATHAYVFVEDKWWFESRSTQYGTLAHFISVGTPGVVGCAELETAGGNYRLNFYTRDLDPDRPGKTTDTWSDSTDEYWALGVRGAPLADSGSAAFYLPRLHGESNQFVRINRVSIDVHYWNATGYESAAVTCTVVDRDGNSLTYDNDGSHTFASTDGTTNDPKYERIVFNYASAPFTEWAEVRFSGVKSLAIENVHIDYEVEDRSW